MTTLSKDHLPESIEHKGQTYTYNRMITTGWERNNTPLSFIVKELKKDGRKAILVKVLAKNLRGKLDIHNKPYQPTEWIYTTEH